MSVLAPPSQDELELLIREARARQRRRWLVLAVGVAAVAAAGLSLWAAIPRGGSVVMRGHGAISNAAGSVSGTAGLRLRGISTVGSSGGVTWAINGHGIWLTTNGGRRWRRSVPGDIAAAGIAIASPPEVQFADKRDGWMSAALAFDRRDLSRRTRDWEIDRTTDGGRTWQLASPPGCRGVCVDGSFSFLDASHGFLLAATGGAQEPNKLFRTSDGGRTWQLVSRPSIWGPITFVNSRDGFAGGPGEGIIGLYEGPPIVTLYRTTDGGRTWSKYDIGGSKSFVELPIDVFGSRVVLVQNAANLRGGLNLNPGTVWGSRDAGVHWSGRPVPSGVGVLSSFSAASPGVWALSSGSDLYITRNAGRSWTSTAVHGLRRTDRIWRIDLNSSRVGWAIFTGRFGPGQYGQRNVLFRTTDGGRHWTPAGPRAPTKRRRAAS